MEFIRTLLILWLVLFLLFLPAYCITRNWDWAGLLLAVFFLGFLSSDDFSYAYSITALSILVLLWGPDRALLKRWLGTRQIYLVVCLYNQ